MYSYSDENFIFNSMNNDKWMDYYNLFNNGEFDCYVDVYHITEFLAALDEYVAKNPNQIDLVVDYLMEIVRHPQKYIDFYGSEMGANQHIEAAPRILNKKAIQYRCMKDGKEYEANIASLDAQDIHLAACWDVCLEMELNDVIANIEHDRNLIDLRKKIEVAKHMVCQSGDNQWQQRLDSLQNDYNEVTKSKKI